MSPLKAVGSMNTPSFSLKNRVKAWAERIKQLAKDSGVTMIENKPVARALLATCVVGQPIAPMLYAAVAEILAFVYRLKHGSVRHETREAA